MASQVTWWFVMLLVACQCGVSLSTEEDSRDTAAISELDREGAQAKQPFSTMNQGSEKKPAGAFPTQELKQKSSDIERQYLAKQRVIAERKEEKWNKKVLKVKVGRYADYLQEKKKKDMDKEMEENRKILKIRNTENGAKKVARDNKQRAAELDDQAAFGHERQKKATKALADAITKVKNLKNADGLTAESDRNTAIGMLAKMRVAQAHADGTIAGLTPRQKKMNPILMLHNSIELATGTPSNTNIDAATEQIKETTEWSTKESYKKVEQMNTKYEKDTKAFEKGQRDAIALRKEAAEVHTKKTTEKDGKREESISDGLELPAKRQKEIYEKKKNDELREKWYQHEKRLNGEFSIKANVKFEKMKVHEVDAKKKKAAKEKIFKEECAKLDKKKMKALENRNKAIGAFNKARENLIVAQGSMNNVAPYDPSKEKAEYVNKGKECQMQSKFYIGGPVDASAEKCKELCSEKGQACNAFNALESGTKCQLLKRGAVGDHVECPVNPKTGEKDCPHEMPSDCSIYQAISGPGAMGGTGRKLLMVEASGQMLANLKGSDSKWRLGESATTQDYGLVGLWRRRRRRRSRPATPTPVARPTARPTNNPTPNKELIEKSNAGDSRQKEISSKQGKHAESGKKQEAKEAKEAEKQVKADNKNTIAAEQANKKQAIAENLASEKRKKNELAEMERQAHNKEEKMQEANVKAADADTQARHCEGEMFRRRRTCACDDMAGPGKVVAQGGRLLGESSDTEQSGWGKKKRKRNRAGVSGNGHHHRRQSGRRLLGAGEKASSTPSAVPAVAPAPAPAPLGEVETSRFGSVVKAAKSLTTRSKDPGMQNKCCNPVPMMSCATCPHGWKWVGIAECDLKGRCKPTPSTPKPTWKPTPAPTAHPTPSPTPPPYSEEQRKIDQKKMDNWERRRYVRRRYVKPSAADRRRRYAFPAPPPPARLPGAICPCCPPNEDPKSSACIAADEKEMATKNKFNKKSSKGHSAKKKGRI